MRVHDMLTIYEYNYWAKGRILAAAANISPEQWNAPSSFLYGSLDHTLLHTRDTESGWRMLCQHNQLTPDFSAVEFPTLDLIKRRWDEEETAMRAYLAGMNDGDLSGLVRYATDSGEKRERVLWHCLLHVANHGTQHRSEAAALLTEYGSSPGDLDFTMFLNERR
ncbi:MAG: DinB family protein [Chloroflexota bacterium]|nr:DinB family protein [Chloroflexota bacterium]